MIVGVIAVLLGGIALILMVAMGMWASNQNSSNNPAPAPTTTQAPVPENTEAPADDVVIDFEPAGTWAFQMENATPISIQFHSDGTYQASNGQGSWEYVAQEHRLTLNGLHVDLNSGAPTVVNVQITIEGKSGDGFFGHVAAGGESRRMSLTRE